MIDSCKTCLHTKESCPYSRSEGAPSPCAMFKKTFVLQSVEPEFLLKLGGVLSYTTKGCGGICGQTVGAEGSGDFSVLILGTLEQANKICRDYIQKLEQSGHRLERVIFTPCGENESYYGNPVSILEEIPPKPPQLDERDLKIDTYRMGFSPNVHVRVTHLPTGLVVSDTGKPELKLRHDLIKTLAIMVAIKKSET